MTRIMQKSFLQGDLADAKALLEEMPDTPAALFARMSLESRLRENEEALAELERQTGKTAEVLLYFYGEPVIEDHGIDAKFSAEVLQAYQDLVSRQAAARRGPVKGFGPPRAAKETRLHVTNVIHGSFGFELEEVVSGPVDLFTPTPLALAVGDVSELLQAAQADDEAFADAAARIHERVYSALEKFLGVIYRANARCRLVLENREVRFTEDTLAKAFERASATREAETVVPVEGEFCGVLAVSRRFEHQQASGEVIQGVLGPWVDAEELALWTGRVCTAYLRRLTLQQGTKIFTRYTLLMLTDREGNVTGGPGVHDPDPDIADVAIDQASSEK